jgi:hypothetical protein
VLCSRGVLIKQKFGPGIRGELGIDFKPPLVALETWIFCLVCDSGWSLPRCVGVSGPF